MQSIHTVFAASLAFACALPAVAATPQDTWPSKQRDEYVELGALIKDIGMKVH